MPVSRRELIKKFRALGFNGPYSGGRHQFMAKGDLKAPCNPSRLGSMLLVLWPSDFSLSLFTLCLPKVRQSAVRPPICMADVADAFDSLPLSGYGK